MKSLGKLKQKLKQENKPNRTLEDFIREYLKKK